MSLSEEANKFIQENPLAKEILLLLTEKPDTYFMFNWRYGSRESQAGLIVSQGWIGSDSYPKTYCGKKAEEVFEVLKKLEKEGVLEGWISGCSSPFFYCIAGEDFTRLSGENKTPEIRQGLRRSLN